MAKDGTTAKALEHRLVALRDALTAVRLLLTFEGLHAASRPGAAALRLSVRRLLDAVQVSPPELAPPRLARLCGVLLQALR